MDHFPILGSSVSRGRKNLAVILTSSWDCGLALVRTLLLSYVGSVV